MKIRSANKSDLDRVIALQLINAQYHADLVSNGKLKVDLPSFFEKHTRKVFEKEASKIFVGEQDGAIIAYAVACIDQQHPVFDLGMQGLIDDIYVSVAFQRLGYGALLLEAIMAWFREKEIERVDLNVYESNEKGAGFWQKHGFEVQFRRLGKQVIS